MSRAFEILKKKLTLSRQSQNSDRPNELVGPGRYNISNNDISYEL